MTETPTPMPYDWIGVIAALETLTDEFSGERQKARL
jgi:hypothetical protein